MGILKSKVLFVLFLATGWLTSSAQVNRYFVNFTDKMNSPYSVENPSEYLSQSAIERREQAGVSITEVDFPVNQNYVEELRTMGVGVYHTSRWFNGAIIQMDESMVQQVDDLSFVESVYYIAKGAKLSNEKSLFTIPDTFLDPSEIKGSTSLQLGMINADDMHQEGYTGGNIRIAVLDGGFTGVNRYSPFENLQKEGRVLVEMDLVENSDNPYQYSSHGTSVLSTIVAEYNDFKGTAFDSEILLYVTEDVSTEYRIEEYNWLVAAEHADSAGVDIIQTSVGYNVFNDGSMNYEYTDMDGETAVITKAAELAFERGIFVVTSAGNEGNNPDWPYITAPADGENVLSVGSIDAEYASSYFSSVGPTSDGRIKPDVVALGTRTAIVNGGGNISTGNGTSYSAPIIAGLVAGLWQANPEWTNRELLNAIRSTSSRAFEPDVVFGYGIPNYSEAVIGRILAVSDILADKIKVFPNPFRDNKVFIDITNNRDSLPIRISVYDTKGTLIVEKEITGEAEDLVELNISSSEMGIYFLKLDSRNFSKQFKLLKY